MNSIHTSCKDCVFAIYEGKTQTDCFAGRTKAFPKEDVIECHDEEKEFYVINRNCNYKTIYTDVTLEETLERVRKLTQFKCDLVIETLPNLDDTMNLLKILGNFSPAFEKILIMNNCHSSQTIQDNISYQGKWEIISKLGRDVTLTDLKNKFISKWLIYTTDLKALPTDIVGKLNKVLNEKMLQFVHLYGTHVLFQTELYKTFAVRGEEVPTDFLKTLDNKEWVQEWGSVLP